MSESSVSFTDFTFQYFAQSEPTLHGIDLTVRKGEKILIAGPSGSGKSTLGHCLNGLIPFSYKGRIQGSLKIQGLESKEQDIFTLSKIIGTVLQDSDGQFVGLSVGEDIAFALENDAAPVPEMRERVRKAAEMVDMGNLLKMSPFELSGGQKQRTALAGVMIDDVDILLFDEPLANLDPATGKAAIEIIDDIHKRSGKTVIIIEHRLEDVLHRDVDRIIVINDGRVVADMNADELVCSDVLARNGIREPLYITALKYAGVELSPEMRPGRIDTADLSGCADKLRAWQKSVEPDTSVNTNPSILRMENVDYIYPNGRQALHDISFDIRKGEMVSIIGKNGAGKSTLTKLICGFVKPDSGAIYYAGEDFADKTIKERADRVGLVMQNPNQMISQTMIADEVGLGLKLRGIPEDETAVRVKKALEVCGLAPFIDWPVSALSFGQKKRVTIASMLALDPKILILDEPTAGQDYRHYSDIMRFLRELNRQGITIILITHDMHLMLEYTPRAIVIADGRVIADIPASEALTNAEIIEKANLKATSLYALAPDGDGTAFVQSFIDYEKWLSARKDGHSNEG